MLGAHGPSHSSEQAWLGCCLSKREAVLLQLTSALCTVMLPRQAHWQILYHISLSPPDFPVSRYHGGREKAAIHGWHHMTHDPQAEEERDDMERVKLDNKRILFNLLPAHVAQHFLMSNPRNMVSSRASRSASGVPAPRGSLWFS